MTAAELIERLAALPPDTIVGIKDYQTGLIHHLSTWPLRADQWGVALLSPNLRVITEEDVA